MEVCNLTNWLVLGARSRYRSTAKTIFHRSCPYLLQPLTIVGAWTLLIWCLYVHFVGSSRTLKFQKYTLTGGLWVPIRCQSTAHNISWILFKFGTTIDLFRGMNLCTLKIADALTCYNALCSVLFSTDVNIRGSSRVLNENLNMVSYS